MEDLIAYFIMILFVIMAIALFFGKGSWLIAGYNTATKEEKAKYNERKLCRAVGTELLFMTGMIAVMQYVDTDEFALYMLIPIVLSIGILMWFANVKCKNKS